MKTTVKLFATLGLLALVAAVQMPFALRAGESAIAPKFLWSVGDADGMNVSCDQGVAWKVDGGKFAVSFEPGDAAWPGFSISPKSGTWDLSTWGHVEMTLTNPGQKPLSVGLRVDNNGDWKKQPWNSENVYLKPGETKVGKVIFGYQYGFQKGYKLDSSKVSAVKVFLNGKSAERRVLVVGDVSAAGAAGEKPPVDPSRVVVVPKGGVIPGAPLKVSVAKTGQAVPLRPKSGYWNLGQWLKVVATVKNTGAAAATPIVAIESSGERLRVTHPQTLKPGETAKIEIPFIPAVPWSLKGDGKDAKPTGGTKFESHRVRGFNFSAVETGASYEVVSVKAEKVKASIPAWLGKRPPVEGKWTKTLSEEFNAGKLDEKVWSPYTANYWDKRTHFTRENLLFKDGCIVLKYEKKRGRQNDEPDGKETDYACGILDSYDRWTQRYGYFEARMKLPTKPGLWPAFWTMPDRGPSAGPERWKRNSTHNGGMEFDIMEHLTAWGPYRFNVACHWDGYQKEHRAVGSTCIYMPADDEGFITVGMLWLPGVWAIYGNGVELARWESARVSDVPAHIFFDVVSGGWANEPLDDDLLPDELRIDWVRVWQRDDLLK